jgi:hypothetical protein
MKKYIDQNLEDVRLRIREEVKSYSPKLSSMIKQWGGEDVFVRVLTQKSEGNFMYLYHVLNDIKSGTLNPANIDNIQNLPQGLRAYYHRHWRTMRLPDPELFDKFFKPVVCILAAAERPLAIPKIAEYAELSPLRVKEVIQEWREFLNEYAVEGAEVLYRFYHESFRNFLKEDVGLVHYNKQIKNILRGKIA